MNEMNNARVITLKDLWDLLIRRIIVIVLAAAVVAAGFFALDMTFYRPQYSSTASLYIQRTSEESASVGEAANELSLALRLVYDCNYFLKSRTVLNAVIEDLDLDMTYSQLYSRISAVNPANTRIMEITVRGDSPEQAKMIVDRICDLGPEKIEAAIGFSQVHLYEYGELPERPSNRPGVMKYVVAGVAAALAAYAVFLLKFIMDDRIRSDEDIEKTLGLSVLAEIPNANGGGIGRYGYFISGKRSYTPGGRFRKNRKSAANEEKRS